MTNCQHCYKILLSYCPIHKATENILDAFLGRERDFKREKEILQAHNN